MKLSPPMLDVARLICDGKSNDEIAVALGITPHCAKWRVREIMDKIDAPDRANIAARVAASGLWHPAPDRRVEIGEVRERIPRAPQTSTRIAKGARQDAAIQHEIPKVTTDKLAEEGVFEVGAVEGTQIVYVVTEDRTVLLHKHTINEALRQGWRERVGSLRPVHPADRGEIHPGRENARARIQDMRPL